MNDKMHAAFFDELQKIAKADIPWRKAFSEGGVQELLPGITAGLGAMIAAKHKKSPSAGAALGGSLGAIPFLLRKG